MYHLGVPTSRSLSLMLTGDQVLRDMLYDGNAAYEKGAVVCRVARSFVRFGSFEIHLANQDFETLKKLADYIIRNYYPELDGDDKGKYSRLFREVALRSLDMVVHWQRVGFVHGVMNTDNMSILGDTIDYGPYGWLEGYEPDWTPNTTDAGQRRYRYGQQPSIVYWNLSKLANALYPLVEEAAPFEDTMEEFQIQFQLKYKAMFLSKLGLATSQPEDNRLIIDLKDTLQLTETDMTIFFRQLAEYRKDQAGGKRPEILEPIHEAFYRPEELNAMVATQWAEWINRYLDRLQKEERSDADRRAAMNQVNPKYVLRNYMAQLAIDAADNGDYSLIQELHTLLKKPYADQPGMDKWYARRPEWARHKVGCSMLSCSS